MKGIQYCTKSLPDLVAIEKVGIRHRHSLKGKKCVFMGNLIVRGCLKLSGRLSYWQVVGMPGLA